MTTVRRSVTLVMFASLAFVFANASVGATLNTAQLDNGTCGRNLQLGSDRTSSSSATPSFVIAGDGGLSRYEAFVDGVSIGIFASDGFANVCVYDNIPLADGMHLLTANELQPHAGLTITPFNFSVDTVPPAQPTTPVISGYSDSGLLGDHITRFTNPNFTGFADPNVAIQLFNGQALLGGAKALATGAWSATAGGLADGSYIITAIALDQAGNKSSLSVVCPLTVDTVLPTGSLTSPTDGSLVSGTVNLAATASDNTGIWKVDFQVDGVTKSTSLTAPYSYAWSSSTVPNGSHTLTAIIHDYPDNTITRTATVNVQNSSATPPGAPTLNSATAGNATVALNWTAPASNGGSAITGYKVYRGTFSGGETLLTTLANVTSWSDNSVTNGTPYFYEVTAVNAVGESGLSNEASAVPAGAPGPPTLTAASPSSGSVALSWNAPASNGGAGITGYRVYRSTASGGEILLTTLGAVTSWTDTGLTNGTTYYYKVTALNSVGESALSNELSGTPAAAATVPGAPVLNSATAGSTTVSLSWSAPGSNGGSAITGYKVYRGTTSGGETLLATLGNVTSFGDSGLANGTTYYYKVTAVNAVGEGGQSNERSATPATVPGAPALNSVTAGNGTVALAWAAPASNGGAAITNYKVYRGTFSGGETLFTTLGNVASWTDTSVTNGTTYYYKVSAVNSVGDSATSGESSATPAGVPGAPTLNSVVGGNLNVVVTWSAPASNGGSAITGYKVYRGTASGGETLLTTLGVVTSFTDLTGILNGTTYYYRVSAVNAAGEGLQSSEGSAIPAGPPGAPTLNTATAASGSVTLAWSAPASNGGSGITGYRIYRGTTSGGETSLTTLGAVTGFTDSGVTNGTTYYYKVTALNSVGEGPLSNEKFATPAASATAPGAPTLNSATAGVGNVALSWSAPAADGGSAVTGYRVYRGTTSGGETLLTTLGAVTGFTDSGLANGTTYYYKVSALNSVGEGTLSNERFATPAGSATVPGAPTLDSATAGNGSVTLSWSAPASDGGSAITGYKVWGATSSGNETVLTTVGNVTSWSNTGLTNGTTYYYKITAVNGMGQSFFSNERFATPAGSATVPTAPTLNSATSGPASVALSWSAPASDGGSAVTSYKVYRGTASGGETFLTTLGNVTSWTDGNVTNGTTYFYKVSAVNSTGEGALSSERSAIPATVPDPPTLAPAGAGNSQVSLSWTPPSSNGGSAVTGYKVYRGTQSGGETLLATLGNSTTYNDGTPANGTTYYYKVSALNAVGESTLSGERSATPATVPGAPTLNSPTASSGSVALSWSAPASNGGATITGYRVYRSTLSGAETLLASPGNVTSYTDNAVVNGTTYYYKVTASNSAGEGTLSNERFATPVAAATVPGAPSLDSATAGSGSVALAWTAPASNGGAAITGYRVYRGTFSGGETFLATLGNVTGFTDSTAVNGTTYYYKVTASNSVGEGGLSNERFATPVAVATVPGAPSLDSATAADGSVALSWSAPASNGGATITGYRVYRSTLSGAETLLASPGNVTSYTDNAVVNGTTYYYKVSALNAVGESTLSGEQSATPATTPGAPNLVSAVTGNSVTLGWNAPAANGGSPVSGYRIYRSTLSGAETFLVAVGAVSSYTDETTTFGTTYYYKVSAVNAMGEGGLSNELSATPVQTDGTAPSTPASVKALVAGTSQVALNWTASTDNVGVTGYRVYRDGALVGTTPDPHYLDGGLVAGSSHTYQVRAFDAAGNVSAASSTLSARCASLGTGTTGTLSGVVYNAVDKLLSNVVVSLRLANGTVKSAKTNNTGVWKLSSLPVGTYTLTATLNGYPTASFTMSVVEDQTLLAITTLGT